MPNKIYRLAGDWIKQPSCTKGGGYSAIYMAKEECAKLKKQRNRPKNTVKSKGAETPRKHDEQARKEPKDLPLIQRFECKEYGHYSTSKEGPMHKKKAKNQDDGIANTS
jgi:hypothetical protein